MAAPLLADPALADSEVLLATSELAAGAAASALAATASAAAGVPLKQRGGKERRGLAQRPAAIQCQCSPVQSSAEPSLAAAESPGLRQQVIRAPARLPPPFAAFGSVAKWADALRGAGLRLQVAPGELLGDLSRVEFAICWNPPPGLLQQVGSGGLRTCIIAVAQLLVVFSPASGIFSAAARALPAALLLNSDPPLHAAPDPRSAPT